MAYQSQVSVWQVHFSFQCYVDLEKLTQKFGSMSPIVNCNPRREEITCRKLFLHRLQRVLGTITTSGCQSEQTWDSLSESKPRVKIEWKFSQRWQAQCMAVYWSKTVKTEVTECLPLVNIPSPPPKITENQVNKPEVVFFLFITTEQFSGMLVLASIKMKWESEYFWSLKSSKITFQTSVSNVNRKQRPPEVYLYL